MKWYSGGESECISHCADGLPETGNVYSIPSVMTTAPNVGSIPYVPKYNSDDEYY